MGLDVHLYQYFDVAKADEMEDAYDKGTTAIWDKITGGKGYDKCSDAEKDEARKQSAELGDKLGMVKGEYGWHSIPDTIQREAVVPDSEIDPEHMFKLNYLRSSYNEGGVNHVAKIATGKDGLYWIFDRERDEEYRFQPDWNQSHMRALELARELEANAEANGGDLIVMEASVNMFSDPAEVAARCSSKEDALKLFKDELEKNKDSEPFGGGGYSNGIGEFYINDPLQLVGIIHGGSDNIMASLVGGAGSKPCTYLVCRGSDDRLKSYVDSLRITAEMCEFVLKHDTPEQFYLHWSA